VGLVVFRLLSRALDTSTRPVLIAALIVVAIVVWWLVLSSGVHATIAGVALGLVMAQQPAMRARHELEPWVNGIVLPLFALSAALVAVPQVSPANLSPAFWGVALALPLGKIVGIMVGGVIAQRVAHIPGLPRLALGDLLALAALGGIGFTVSLLMAELSFEADAVVRDQAILGVMAGSLASLVLGGMLVSWRAWHHRRLLSSAP